MAEPKDPALPRMREWPLFRPANKRRRNVQDGRAPPKIADLIIERLSGTPAQKLAWLREQVAHGKLDGDDPDEIAQAEALLLMLGRVSASRSGSQNRHLDELLDEGLRNTFPASDPVAVGRYTSTEPPSKPVDREAVEADAATKPKRSKPPARSKRAA
jgi:hypothetical protein